MSWICRRATLLFVALCLNLVMSGGALLTASEIPQTKVDSFTIENDEISLAVHVKDGILSSEQLQLNPAWPKPRKGAGPRLATDADFSLEIMWTEWRAPGKANNADNPVVFTKRDFLFIDGEKTDLPGGTKELRLRFKGSDTPFDLLVTYQLPPHAFYVRRQLALRDTTRANHFLRAIAALDARIEGLRTIVKEGDFGQPVALTLAGGGAFFGLEYPASMNTLVTKGKEMRVRCAQEFGQKIEPEWTRTEWVVQALTPDDHVKLWFMKYVDDIRVAPLRPYTLYNSWYDLRSAEYPKVPAAHQMNEENILRIIGLIRSNMVEKNGIHVDAIVLDDGWDVYKSDWVLRPQQFPRGLKPISDEIRKMNSVLGIWLGPIGGYSFREERISWMKDHGYEVVNDQLCLAGRKYSELFRKRVVDFVKNDGVAYFKWDGIQFSCSEPDHGHPVDIYSRRAVLESVLGMERAVRAANPDVYVNTTSGTWLSPWWLKYSNQVWMDGQDYGYADVPSISKRDGAITYRDVVLYEDFAIKDLWMPIANLMTHGIIKGRLEMLGTEDESLDKFTDDALLYFARGVSMWELYVSPDLLKEGEWNALAGSIKWAKDRFPVLASTTMVGGDPSKMSTYGYVHYVGNRGIIAARNPVISKANLTVELSAASGLDPEARSLVVEKVYPVRSVFPGLFKTGSRINLPLDGYEMAVYEVYPLDEAKGPLVTGGRLDGFKESNGKLTVNFYPEPGAKPGILNPASLDRATVNGKTASLERFAVPAQASSALCTNANVRVLGPEQGPGGAINVTVGESLNDARLAVLVQPTGASRNAADPTVTVVLDGKNVEPVREEQQGKWGWYSMPVAPGAHRAEVSLAAPGTKRWTGRVEAWLVGMEHASPVVLEFGLKGKWEPKPMPPAPWPEGNVRRTIRIGQTDIAIR